MSRLRCSSAGSAKALWVTVQSGGPIRAGKPPNAKAGSAGTGTQSNKRIKCAFCSRCSNPANNSIARKRIAALFEGKEETYNGNGND